jgi:hypothetical protein
VSDVAFMFMYLYNGSILAVSTSGTMSTLPTMRRLRGCKAETGTVQVRVEVISNRDTPGTSTIARSRSIICSSNKSRRTRSTINTTTRRLANVRHYVPGTCTWYTMLLTREKRDNKKMSHHLTVLQIVLFEMSYF